MLQRWSNRLKPMVFGAALPFLVDIAEPGLDRPINTHRTLTLPPTRLVRNVCIGQAVVGSFRTHIGRKPIRCKKLTTCRIRQTRSEWSSRTTRLCAIMLSSLSTIRLKIRQNTVDDGRRTRCSSACQCLQLSLVSCNTSSSHGSIRASAARLV